MHANGHTTVWGTQIGIGRAQDARGWYQQLREWWAAHKAMRPEARLTATPLRANAAADMVAPAGYPPIIGADACGWQLPHP
jgi:hypothetical protein